MTTSTESLPNEPLRSPDIALPLPEVDMAPRDWSRAVRFGRGLLAGSAVIASAVTVGLARASAAPKQIAENVPVNIEPDGGELAAESREQAEQSPQEVIDTYNQKLAGLGQEIIALPDIKVIKIDSDNSRHWALPVGSRVYYKATPDQQHRGRYDLMEMTTINGTNIPSSILIYYDVPGDQPNDYNWSAAHGSIVMGSGHAYKHYKRKGKYVSLGAPLAKLNAGYLDFGDTNNKRASEDWDYTVSSKKHQPFSISTFPPFSKSPIYSSKHKAVNAATVTGAFDQFMNKVGKFIAKARK